MKFKRGDLVLCYGNTNGIVLEVTPQTEVHHEYVTVVFLDGVVDKFLTRYLRKVEEG